MWNRSSIGLWAPFGVVTIHDSNVIHDHFHPFYFESIKEGEDSMGLLEVVVDCDLLLVCSTR